MADVKNTCAAGSIYFSREKAQTCANELTAKSAGDGTTYSVERESEFATDGLGKAWLNYYKVVQGKAQKAGAK